MPIETPKPTKRLALSYINGFSDPSEFSQLVRDDTRHKSRRGIGLRTSVARAVLDYRMELPEQQFSSLEQLLDVRDLGEDTLHDIIYSFEYMPPTQRVLLTLNTETDPQVLSALVRDDPAHGSSRGYGLKINVAQALIEYRQSLPNKRFLNADELTQVKGIGQDTLHDIVHSLGGLRSINISTQELRALSVLWPVLRGNFGTATVAASLALRGLELAPSEIKTLVEKATEVPSNLPQDIARALTLPLALATELVENLDAEEVELLTEYNEEKEELLDEDWLEWLEEIERREETGEDLETPFGPEEPLEDKPGKEEINVDDARDFFGSLYGFDLDFLDLFPPPEYEEPVEIPGDGTVVPEEPVEVNNCLELSQQASALAAVLVGIKAQVLEVVSEVARLDGVIREHFHWAIERVKPCWDKYIEKGDALEADPEYRPMVDDYYKKIEQAEALEGSENAEDQQQLEQLNKEIKALGEKIDAKEKPVKEALKDLKKKQDEAGYDSEKGEKTLSPNELRGKFCREGSCLEYNARYRVLKHRYNALKRAWDSNLAARLAAVAACKAADCPYRDVDNSFPEFPPNLCQLICEAHQGGTDEWTENGVYVNPLCRIFAAPEEDGEGGGEVPVDPGNAGDNPIGLMPPEGEVGACAECFKFYRRFVAKAAQHHQDEMDSLAEKWTQELIEKYAEFHADNGPRIEELLEAIRTADAQLRFASCEIITEPSGRSHVQQRTGDPTARPQARRASRTIQRATRALNKIAKKLEKLNQRLARYQRRLKERYNEALNVVKKRYDTYMLTCSDCDLGLPTVVERFIFLEPESVDIPSTFNGDCLDVSGLTGEERDDDPERQPGNDAPGEGEEEAPEDGDSAPPEPIPEEELTEAIDELLALPLPCQVEKAQIAVLRARVATVVTERANIRSALEQEQTRLLAVLQVAEAGLRLSEAEVKRLEAELQKVRDDYVSFVQARRSDMTADDILGTQFRPPRFNHERRVDTQNAKRAYDAAFERILQQYQAAYDQYQQDYQAYKDAFEAYSTFLEGPFKQGVERYNQKGQELQALMTQIAALLRKCGEDADTGAVPPWNPGDNAPDEVEQETKDTVEELEQEIEADKPEQEQLEQELEDLSKRGPYGRLIKRLLALDKAMEEARQRAQERMDDIRRERGEGENEVEDIDDINRQLERELERLRRRRQRIMERLRRMQGEVDRQYKELMRQLEERYAQDRKILEDLQFRERHHRASGEDEKADKFKTRREEFQRRFNESYNRDLEKIREHLGAEDFPEGHLHQENLERYLQEQLRKGTRLRELRRIDRARQRAVERLRNASPPTTAELFEIYPDAAGEDGPLEQLLNAIARPGAFIAQRKNAPKRVLGPEMDAKRAALDLKSIAAEASELGVNGDLLANLLLRGKNNLQEMWRFLREVLAAGVANQDGTGDDLIVVAAGALADAYSAGQLRPNFPLAPGQTSLDDWRRWIENADFRTLLGLLVMQPPQEAAQAILDRLEVLRQLGETVEVPEASALVRQILAALARANELTQPIWINAFEKALSLVDAQFREGLLNLLRLYQDNLPDPNLDGLDSDALLRRMNQAADWETWRKLFNRAAFKAEPRHFRLLMGKIRLADFQHLSGFPAAELEAQQAALTGTLAEALGRAQGAGADRDTWLALYAELKQGIPLLVGLRPLVAQRLRDALEESDLNDLQVINQILDLALEEGPEGDLDTMELLQVAQASATVQALLERIRRGEEGENWQPQEILLQWLTLQPEMTPLTNDLLEGLQNEHSHAAVVDVLEQLGASLGDNLGNDAERSEQYFQLLARMFAGALDERVLGDLVGLIRQVEASVWQRELNNLLDEGGEETLQAAFELAWALGVPGLSFLTEKINDEGLDDETRADLRKLLFKPGRMVFRPASMGWDDLARELYGDARLGAFLAEYRIGGSDKEGREAWLAAPLKLDLESDVGKAAYDLSVSAQDLLRKINPRGLADTEQTALREMQRRLGALRSGWDMDAVARFNEAKSLHQAAQRIAAATKLRQELRELFERPGITEADRALFERFAAKVRALYSTNGSAELFHEIQRYHELLERMLPVAAQRAQLEQLSKQLDLDYGSGRQNYGVDSEAKRLALHTIRQFTRERAGLGGRLDSLEVQLSKELEKLAPDSQEIRDLDDAMARLRAELGRAIHSGSRDTINEDRIDAAKQAAKDLIAAWEKAVGFVPERMWRIQHLLDTERSGETLFQDLIALFNADRRIREEAPLRRREMAEMSEALKVFDLDAYGEHVQGREIRRAAEDPVAQERIAKRRETQEFMRPLESLERESQVTAQMHTNLGKAIDNVSDELRDLEFLVNEHMDKIRRSDPEYRAQWAGVLRALRLSQEALNRASRLWYQGHDLRALRELKTAMSEMGITSIGFSNEVELFTYHQQVKLINEYYDSHFETPYDNSQRTRYLGIANALIAARRRVRFALDTFGTPQERQNALLEANNQVGALMQDQHAATIGHIQFFYKMETTGKALLAVAAAALTAGLLTPVAEAALANVAIMGLRVLQIGRAIALLPRFVAIGSLLFETAVFTSVHHIALNLLQNKYPVNDKIFGEFVKNLVLFGLLKIVGIPFSTTSRQFETAWQEFFRGLARFGSETGIFFGIAAAESMWQNVSKGNSPTEGIAWGEVLVQTVLSLAVMKQAAFLGRSLVPKQVMERLSLDPNIPAGRLREVNRRLTELDGEITRQNAELQRVLEGEVSAEQQSLRELFEAQQRLLERKAEIALELELMGIVQPGTAATLRDFQRSSLEGVRNATKTGRELLEDVGMRRLTDNTYTFREGKQADLIRILEGQGFTVQRGLRNIIAHIGEQVLMFRARLSVRESEVGSRQELAETLNQLRLDSNVVRLMLEKPNTYRAVARNGEIVLIRVRPGQVGRTGLELPVARPAAERTPGEFRVGKLSPRRTSDEVRFEFDGRNVEASGRSLSELMNEILVAQGAGRGVDLIVTPEKMIRVEIADGLSLRPEAILENPIVKQLQRFANEHELNLAIGMRFHNSTSDANGALVLRAGRRARWIRDREHLDGQNRSLEEVLRLTTVEINGMRVSFSVCSDTANLRGDTGDAHVILASARAEVINQFRNLIPDAVIANWVGGPMGGNIGISYRSFTHPARVVENLNQRVPETFREPLARLLEGLKQIGSKRLHWQVARELIADAHTHNWSALEAAQNRGAGAARQLFELLGEAGSLNQLVQFMQAAQHLQGAQRSQAQGMAEQAWANRLGEIARELPYHPRMAELLRGEVWARFGDRIKLETGIDVNTLPSAFENDPAWHSLIAELGFGRAPHGTWRELGRNFDINALRELSVRSHDPETLKDRVLESDVPNLKQHLENSGIGLDFVVEPFANNARAEARGEGGRWTIRLNQRSTWLDLLNEVYKVKLLQELGVDGQRAFTSEMRAAVELASFRFLERQILRGTSLTERLGESVQMGLFWRARLAGIRDGRFANFAENLPGEMIVIQAAGSDQISVSVRARLARMLRLLEVANTGSGTFSGRYSEETLNTIEELTNRATQQLEANRQAMNDLYTAVRLLSEAQTPAQRAAAEQVRAEALRRMEASEREAVSKLNLAMDIIHTQTSRVITRWGVTTHHQHAAGRFDELVTDYNHLSNVIRMAWARAFQARDQGRILDFIVRMAEAYRLQARRNRISERLGSEGAAEAFEARHPEAELIWPKSSLAQQPGSGRLDRVYKLGDEIIVIEEKGGSSRPGTAEYMGQRAMQLTLAHTLGTATRMKLAGEKILGRNNTTQAERDFANELIGTANLVISGWRTGKMRMFLGTTKWVKVDGLVTGWEATMLTGVILRWGSRTATPEQFADPHTRLRFIKLDIQGSVNRIVELREGMGGVQ